jgi:hypothetical protein
VDTAVQAVASYCHRFRIRLPDMEVQPEHSSGEIKHLQPCINDLVSLLAVPAIWSGGDPSHVLHTLLDALMRMLNLDLVSVRLTNPAREAPVEIVRVAQLRVQMPRHTRSARRSATRWKTTPENGLHCFGTLWVRETFRSCLCH